ncbi:bifunctional transcriptional activator/DNA repair enzyme AdaA [Saccharothrix obliqua]|uniref:bifunctional transcriptional activator/DNA repair enzyme AdaA n=1 Tax=Saccharothrix obliqua TaxID=2861747 RepID=UPI001C6007EC|nr:Ada metal-binding domain-containing protein [Saccharothrix obliqua]MBW4717537.1 helix-turn-helix domain-containing protein [Saccharothrix obliqua]
MTVTDEERWDAVRTRSSAADGVFFYSVRTTGVYNRPTCVARVARRENVVFFATAAEAEAAGYRPCRRCRPDEDALREPALVAVTRACRLVAGTGPPPRLDDLAGLVGFSRFHFHRMFKAVTGLTPHAYVAALRADRVRAALAAAASVTDAIYGAGFNSNGAFYASARDILGMTPTMFRAGGAGACIRHHVARCASGLVLVAFTDGGLCDVLLGDDADDLVARLRATFPGAVTSRAGPESAERVDRAVRVAEPPRAARGLPEDIHGVLLRQRVREVLRDSRWHDENTRRAQRA